MRPLPAEEPTLQPQRNMGKLQSPAINPLKQQGSSTVLDTMRFSSEPEPTTTNPLTSLPLEVQTNIYSFLDTASLCSLALTSKSCYDTVLPAIRRTYDWTKGTRAPAGEPDQCNAEELFAGSSKAVVRTMRRSPSEISHQIAPFGDQLHRQGWRYVKKLALRPRSGTRDTMIQALAILAPQLLQLDIGGTGEFMIRIPSQLVGSEFERFGAGESKWIGHDCFDIVKSMMSFPALTHARVDGYFCLDDIPKFLGNTPNLSSLELDLRSSESANTDRPPLALPPLNGNTKLKRLRLVFDTKSLSENEDEFKFYREMSLILSLLSHSPSIEQLVLETDDNDDGEYPEPRPGSRPAYRILPIISRYRHLQNLFWGGSALALRDYIETANRRASAPFPHLQRLIMAHGYFDEFGMYEFGVVPLPNLRHLYEYYENWYDLPAIPPARFTQAPLARPMVPALAAGIRLIPKIHDIYHLPNFRKNTDQLHIFSGLDAYIERSTVRGSVRAIRCGSSEILHVRSLIEDSEVLFEDTRLPVPDPFSAEYMALDYERKCCQKLNLRFSTWQDFTDYEGQVVPLEVIEKMREVEGASAAQWEGRRDIEVGEAAWQVLLDWRDAPVV